jgi:alkylated DNA repair protein alkB family protein 7
VKGKFRPEDFTIVPDFLTLPEQRILLATSLQKLDSIDSRQFRRLRRTFLRSRKISDPTCSVQDMFLPDQYYQFEEVNILMNIILPQLNTQHLGTL